MPTNRDITPAMEKLAATGLQVFFAPDRHGRAPTYCFFSDGIRIGYVQTGEFGGLKFSTVHIPNHNTGTGFGDLDHAGTLESGVAAAFAFAPPWANARDVASVKKYRDLAHWLKDRSNSAVQYVEFSPA